MSFNKNVDIKFSAHLVRGMRFWNNILQVTLNIEILENQIIQKSLSAINQKELNRKSYIF